MTNKKLIFLESTEDCANGNFNLTQSIENLCSEFKIDFEKFEIQEIDDIETLSNKVQCPADYLVVGAHGNSEGFGTKNHNHFIRWADFSIAVCDQRLINCKSVIFLGCCGGGFKRGALSAFVNCQLIDTVCGAACSVLDIQLSLALRLYLIEHYTNVHYNSTCTKQKISVATGIPF